MEIISLSGLILIISICIIAFLMGYFISGGREDNKRLEKELEESKNELKNYRSEVTSHFQETAHKVNALTENYREVYEHLAQGAQNLCDKSNAPELINELNRNPMLGGETIQNPEVGHKTISTETDINNEPAQDSEAGTVDKNPDDTADVTSAVDQTKSTGIETNQNEDMTESAEVEENNRGDNTNFEEKPKTEPIVAPEERIEDSQQPPEPKSTP